MRASLLSHNIMCSHLVVSVLFYDKLVIIPRLIVHLHGCASHFVIHQLCNNCEALAAAEFCSASISTSAGTKS